MIGGPCSRGVIWVTRCKVRDRFAGSGARDACAKIPAELLPLCGLSSATPPCTVDMKFLSVPCDPKITSKENWSLGKSLLIHMQFCCTVLSNESSLPRPSILSGFQMASIEREGPEATFQSFRRARNFLIIEVLQFIFRRFLDSFSNATTTRKIV